MSEMRYKIWWIPQIPGPQFNVEVSSEETGATLLKTLADYDDFQFKHHIKPDYANTGGLLMLDGEDWIDWESECGTFSDPVEWLEAQEEQQ